MLKRIKSKKTEPKSNEQGKLFFDGTSETPSIYEKRLDVPAFLRKSQDRQVTEKVKKN